jgi:multisubunit Na+/H+ antiporter MnhE subunit
MSKQNKDKSNSQVQSAKTKAQLAQMVAAFPGVTVVDYKAPRSGKAVQAMDAAVEAAAAVQNQRV